MSELLPCPFCGSEDLEIDGTSRVSGFAVHCQECTASNYGRDREDAVEYWNRRTNISAGPDIHPDLLPLLRLAQSYLGGRRIEKADLDQALHRFVDHFTDKEDA